MKPIHPIPHWFEIDPDCNTFRERFLITIDDVDVYLSWAIHTGEVFHGFIFVPADQRDISSVGPYALKEPGCFNDSITPAIREYVTAYLKLMA